MFSLVILFLGNQNKFMRRFICSSEEEVLVIIKRVTNRYLLIMARVLSVETLEDIVNNIIRDYSTYLQGKIDVESARSSIGYQISTLLGYEYIHPASRDDDEDKRIGHSIVVLPKSADMIDVSLLLNMHGGIARYFLTVRPEGTKRYAVHHNKLYYIDVDNPSKPFDISTFSVTKKYLRGIVGLTTTNQCVNLNDISRRESLEQTVVKVNSSQGQSSSIKSSSNVMVTATRVVSKNSSSSPRIMSSSSTPVSVAVWPQKVVQLSEATQIRSSTQKSTPDSVVIIPSQIIKLPAEGYPKYIYCPTNNGACCYTKKNHPQNECQDPTMVCCMMAVHYPGK